MKDKLLLETKNRTFTQNLIISIFCFLGMFIIPTLVAIILPKFLGANARTIIGDIVFILILVLIFYKDLVKEAKTYFKNFKSNFKHSFKLYILGFIGMVICNLFIVTFLKDISSNESQVREMLYKNVVTTMISISIIAPIMEELLFRKSIAPLFENKWFYVVVSGLLFGSAHILTNFIQGTFVMTDLFYVLPYACLGSSFALMDYNTKSTFSSIVIHSLHNTCTAVMLLITYFGGK